MTLYVDISEFLITRITTGIQRVIREFLQRAVLGDFQINIIHFDIEINRYQLLDNREIESFLKDVKTYQFKNKQEIDILLDVRKNKVFFEIDSVWNSRVNRGDLYKKLKQNNFKIFNFIYDLTPILLPDLARENSKRNFPSFLNSVFEFSDLVLFDSISAKNDFFKFKKLSEFSEDISSEVIYLGSDFFFSKDSAHSLYSKLLSKKYILFVGTIEPRKSQLRVLEAFEELHKKYQDLHLVLVGEVGWKVEELMKYLDRHPLKEKHIHHLTGIDDVTLSLFYQNAFIVTYLSEYEGYGLPVAESLQYGNITITSKNSSMIEVGHNYADYVLENTKEEIVGIISLYINNKTLYNQKKEYIKNSYKPNDWGNFYNTLKNTLQKEAGK